MKRTIVLLGLLAAIALGVAACGSSSDTTSSSTATSTDSGAASGSTTAASSESVDVTAAADGSLAYDQSSLSTKAGAVDVKFDNPSGTTHDVCIRSESGDELGCSDEVSNGTADLAVDLKPGKYTYYCSLPGHEQAGMQGTLTVK